MSRPAIVFVDVDDTLVSSSGSERMPIASTVTLVRGLAERGVVLYCWSAGGADYARRSAAEVGLEGCFQAFLPKPELVLDDLGLDRWRLVQLHPAECSSLTVDEVLARVASALDG